MGPRDKSPGMTSIFGASESASSTACARGLLDPISSAMQAAWKAHGGEAGFEFTVVELLDDDTLGPLGRGTWLKERERHWREALGARPAV